MFELRESHYADISALRLELFPIPPPPQTVISWQCGIGTFLMMPVVDRPREL
jgi:hypothetical protein